MGDYTLSSRGRVWLVTGFIGDAGIRADEYAWKRGIFKQLKNNGRIMSPVDMIRVNDEEIFEHQDRLEQYRRERIKTVKDLL